MKKIILILAALFFTFMYANAQNRPGKGDFSTEMYYTPGGSTDGQFALPEYGAKVRMFLNERMAVSLNLGLNSNSTSITDNGYVPDAIVEENSGFAITVMPGFEYHLTRFERVSPYFGAAILFSRSRYSGDRTSVTGTDYGDDSSSGFVLGTMITSGVDVYVCNGLYVGLEFGIGYEFDFTEVGTEDAYITNSTFGFFATPSLRIGWLF